MRSSLKESEEVVGLYLDLADVMLAKGCSEKDIERAVDKVLEMWFKKMVGTTIVCSNGARIRIIREKRGFVIE